MLCQLKPVASGGEFTASRRCWGAVVVCLLAVAAAAPTRATEVKFPLGEPTAQLSAIQSASFEAPLVKVVKIQDLLKVFKASRGSVTVLNFWATWCKPCLEEMPELVRFYREHQSKGVSFVSVSADHPDDLMERVRPYVERQRIPFAVWVVGGESPDELVQAIDPQWQGSLPATFVFDASGTRRQAWYGKVEFSDLAGAVDSLLQDNPASGGALTAPSQ